MPGQLVKTPYDALTYKIVGDGMAVHRERGPGYREDTYQRDLEVHFTDSGLAYVAQKNIEVYDSANGDVLIGVSSHRRTSLCIASTASGSSSPIGSG